jgi:ketosteroid isomerase-like protein
MSSLQVVRKPVRLREGKSRAFEQRLLTRLPWLAAFTLRLVARLPPSSRLRQALLWRGMRLSAEAFNRRDLDALAPTRDPDFEFHPPPEAVESGLFEPCYRGAAGYLRYLSELTDVWGTEIRIESLELIDMGERLVLLYDAPVRARASGVPLTGKLASVVTLAEGRVIRQQDYTDHNEALEAVGLGERAAGG